MESDDSPGTGSARPSAQKQSLFLPQIVDMAVALTRADKGNLQLIDPATGNLVFAASRGFERWYLDYFASVEAGLGTACGMALATRQRVVIDNVEQSPVFAGKPALDMMLAAQVLAVHSLPIVSRSGRSWGVLSTHWRRHYPEADYDPSLLAYLAEETAEFLERDTVDRSGAQA